LDFGLAPKARPGFIRGLAPGPLATGKYRQIPLNTGLQHFGGHACLYDLERAQTALNQGQSNQIKPKTIVLAKSDAGRMLLATILCHSHMTRLA